MEARNQDIPETEEAGKIELAAFSGVRSWYSWLRAAPWSSSTPTTAHTESEVLAGPGRCRRVGILVLACLHGRAAHEHYIVTTCRSQDQGLVSRHQHSAPLPGDVWRSTEMV